MTTLENLIENPDEWEVGQTIISCDVSSTIDKFFENYIFFEIAFEIYIFFEYTVVPGFKALGPSTAKSALNPGSALFPRMDLVYFKL